MVDKSQIGEISILETLFFINIFFWFSLNNFRFNLLRISEDKCLLGI